jgi:hypothetical protein
MKIISFTIQVVLAVTFFAAICISQERARPSVSDAEATFSFSAPAGWTMTRDAGSYSLINPAKTILLVVRPHLYDTFEAAVRDTKLDADTKVAVGPRDLKNGGKFVRLTKPTTGGLATIDIFVLFSGRGGGATVVGLSDEANAESSLTEAAAIVQSIAFKEPTRAAALSGWEGIISGKHLLYLYSGNGYFEEKHIYLCGSGTFLQKTGEGGFTPGDVDGPSFGARGGRRGTWSVSGNTLVLRFQDGSVGQYAISRRQAGNEIGLNGNRYFVEAQSVCR